jgi:UPF0716 protein FxsA
MGRLLLLFIAVPAIELALLIEIGSRIGTPATLGLIVVTGAIGATLARAQGLAVLRDLQQQLERGELPAGVLVDGLMVLLAAALLVTPGVLTDVVGFSCLVPRFRNLVKRKVQQRFERAVREKRVDFTVFHGDLGPQDAFSHDEEIDVTERGEHQLRPTDRRTLH